MEKIKDSTTRRAASVTSKDISKVAQQGIERALAARQGVTKLSAEQTEEVGGGFDLCLSVAGGYLSGAPAWEIQDKMLFTTGQGIDEEHPGALIGDM